MQTTLAAEAESSCSASIMSQKSFTYFITRE